MILLVSFQARARRLRGRTRRKRHVEAERLE